MKAVYRTKKRFDVIDDVNVHKFNVIEKENEAEEWVKLINNCIKSIN